MINQSPIQPVPQGVVQQRQGYPSLPKPGEVNFLNAGHDDISFEMNPNTGAFEIVDKRTQAKPADQQNQQTTVNQQGTNGTNNQQGTQPADPYQARFAAIENHNKLLQDALIRMAQAMDGMVNHQQNGNQQQQGQQQQVSLDIQSDDFATNLVNLINTTVQAQFKSLEEKLQPLQQTTTQMQGRMEMADTAFQNKDFQELFPIIQEIKKSDPSGTLSWQKAYETAKTIQGTLSKDSISQRGADQRDSTIRTDNGSQTTQPQSGTQDLRQVANQLATETGGVSRSVINNEPRVNSVESAFNEAVNELFGGRI